MKYKILRNIGIGLFSLGLAGGVLFTYRHHKELDRIRINSKVINCYNNSRYSIVDLKSNIYFMNSFIKGVERDYGDSKEGYKLKFLKDIKKYRDDEVSKLENKIDSVESALTELKNKHHLEIKEYRDKEHNISFPLGGFIIASLGEVIFLISSYKHEESSKSS